MRGDIFYISKKFARAVAAVLLFAMVVMPLAPVFAQEVTPEETPTDVSSTTDATPSDAPPSDTPSDESSFDSSTSGTGASDSATPPDETPVDENTPSPSTPSGTDNDPSVPTPTFTYGSIAPKVDKSGALTERLALPIPPGRNGLQPDVALVYNNQNAEDGVVGYGWNFSIPYIERINRTGTENFYNDNYFVSSVSGELATTSDPSSGNVSTSTYTYTGSLQTWTVPSGVTQIDVKMWGGGGGGNGGDNGGGAGAGGYVVSSGMYVTPGETVNIYVARGGQGGVAGSAGGAGGWGYASGGNGACQNGSCGGGGGGSSAVGTTLATSSAAGGGGGASASGSPPVGGHGASGTSGGAGGNGSNRGAGGGGAAATNGTNASGASGGAGGTGGSTITGTNGDGESAGTGGGGSSAGTSGNGTTGSSHNGGAGSGGASAGADGATGESGGGGSGNPFTGAGQSGGTPGAGASGRDCGGGCTGAAGGNGRVEISYTVSTSTTGTEYRAKKEDGSFIRYEFLRSSNKWIAYDKNGIRYLYGTTTQARVYSATTSDNVYRWMLEEVRDPNNNFIRYVYARDNDQLYPSQIIYTGASSTDGIFTIDFVKSSRPDSVVSYKSAFKIQTDYRITEVDASVNNQWVRKYALSYTSGNNGSRSLLSSVQMTGRDENANQYSLPATTFEYTNTNVTFDSGSSSSFPGHVKNAAFVAADNNGDGLTDRTVFYRQTDPTAEIGSIGTNNYPDTSGGVAQTVARNWSRQNAGDPEYLINEDGVRFFDINGDGKADLLQGLRDPSTTTLKLWLNEYATSSGYAWTEVAPTGTIPYFAWTDGSSNYTTGLLGNINGDQLIDYSYAPPVSVGSAFSYVGNGGGFNQASTSQFVPLQRMDVGSSRLVDINGDGLDDWIYSDEDTATTKIYLNTGTNWGTSTPAWTIPTTTISAGKQDKGIRFVDINGDGLNDWIRSYYVATGTTPTGADVGLYQQVYLNTGSGWATSSIVLPPAFVAYASSSVRMQYDEYYDWTGDGIADAANYKNLATRQDFLKKINYPTGGFSSFEYTPATQNSSNKELPYRVDTVTKIINNDNNGNNQEVDYSYSGGKVYTWSSRDREFVGFASTTETRSDAIVKTYYNQGDGILSEGEQTDSIYQEGRPYLKETRATTTGNIIKSNFYRWDTSTSSNNRGYAYLSKEVSLSYTGTVAHSDAATEYTYSTTTGDITQIKNLGEVSAATTTGVYSDVGSDTSIQDITYAASTSINLSVPTQETLTNASSTKFKETKHYYDGLASGSVGAGNETRREDWITASTYASSTRAYNNYGLLTGETDARGASTTYTYDTYNLYKATTTNPLAQISGATYDYATGKFKHVTDPNNLARDYTYDPLGRLIEEKQPDLSTPGTMVTKRTISYADNAYPNYTQTKNYFTSATTSDSYAYVDGLGRQLQSRAQSGTANVFVTKDNVYGMAGELVRESLPYFSTGASSTVATSSAYLYTTYTYDPLGRIASAVTNIGTSTNSYGGWSTLTTDPNGNRKQFINDAYGNLSQVLENVDNATNTTRYSWDIAKNLTNITDALGNVRNFTYDGHGNLLTTEDLHAPSDTTFGTSTFTYDAQNNLLTRIDPKGQEVDYTYDSLNRKLMENYTGTAGTEVTYTYDVCTYGVGRLCVASTTASFASTTYNALGLAAAATSTIDGTSYGTQYSYDRQGNVTNVVYPNKMEVQYGFNLAGQIADVARKFNGESSFTSVVPELTYAPQGQINYRRYANGLYTAFTFDPQALYRLTRIGGNSSTSTPENIAYTYDRVGNITQILDTSTSTIARTVAYTYDALNRLITATATTTAATPYTKNYSYDALGDFGSTGTTTTTYDYTGSLQTLTVPAGVTSISVKVWGGGGGGNGGSNGSGGGAGGYVASSSMHVTPGEVINIFVAQGGQGGIQGSAGGAGGWGYKTGGNGSYATSEGGGGGGGSSAVGVALGTTTAAGGGGGANASGGTPTGGQGATGTSGGSGGNAAGGRGAGGGGAAGTNGSNGSGTTGGAGGTGASTVSGTSGNASNTATGGGGSSAGTSGNGNNASGSTGGSGSNGAAHGTNGAAGESGGAGSGNPLNGLGENGGSPGGGASARDCGGGCTGANGGNGRIEITYGGGSGPSYTYAGTGYANPHAPTTIDGLTLTYDNNGNVTAYGTNTYTYDYLNRMSKSVVGGITATSSYDHLNQRIKLQVGSTTTLYPSKLFSKTVFTNGATTTATTTAYIYVGDTLMALIDTASTNSTTTGTTTNFVHYDHLGSTVFLSNINGATTSAKDYYPFGALRIDTGASTTDKQYIGERYDPSSQLNYLNARMYDSARGQFTSQDPVHLAIGNSAQVKELTGQDLQKYLMDPQSLNSYSYARNNPIGLKDPKGTCFEPASAILCALTVYGIAQTGVDLYDAYNTNIRYGDVFTQEEKNSTNFHLGFDVFTTALGLKAADVGLKTYGVGIDALSATLDAFDTYLGDRIYKKINEQESEKRKQEKDIPKLNLQSSKTYSSGGGVFSNSTSATSYSSGAPSYILQNYTTPNGAVVNWYGKVIVPAPKQTSKK
jgi:RHS repeat-associated protein